MTDTEMIDWLEATINKEGALLLHDGDSNPHGHLGLGLRSGSLRRNLRQAIRQAAGSSSGTAQPQPPDAQPCPR